MSRSTQGYTAHDQNRTDSHTSLATGHDALYIGTDGMGADHYWSIYEQTITVISDDEVELEQDVQDVGKTLGDWVDYVRSERGTWRECRVAASAVARVLRGGGD